MQEQLHLPGHALLREGTRREPASSAPGDPGQPPPRAGTTSGRERSTPSARLCATLGRLAVIPTEESRAKSCARAPRQHHASRLLDGDQLAPAAVPRSFARAIGQRRPRPAMWRGEACACLHPRCAFPRARQIFSLRSHGPLQPRPVRAASRSHCEHRLCMWEGRPDNGRANTRLMSSQSSGAASSATVALPQPCRTVATAHARIRLLPSQPRELLASV